MKILIVNAYSSSPHGQKQFAEFEDIIKQYFLRQKDLMDTETEFFVCDKNNIGDFLYEMSGNYVSKEAAKSFDFIDMVFVEGDANLRPWSPKAGQFVMLLKNCLKTNKILWASQFAMQAIIYLISTDLERPINMVNGNNGEPVNMFNTISKQYPNGKNDFYLDSISGDMYQWDIEINQWKPVHNCGLHFRKKAQECQELGRLVMKTEIYRANTHHRMAETIFEAKQNETICYLKKSLINHYALMGLEIEFLVPSKNSWDAHPIAFINPSKTYTVLGESKFTIQIIEPSAYTLACQFNLCKKYPETIQILCNFIKHQLDKIRLGKTSIPIKNIVNLNEEDNDSLEATLKAKKNSNQEDQKKKKVQACFRHSGFAFVKKDREELMVDNNALHINSVSELEEVEQFNQNNNNSQNQSIQENHKNVKHISFQNRPTTALLKSKTSQNLQQNRILSAKSTIQSFYKSDKNFRQTEEDVEQNNYTKQDLVDERDVFLKNHGEIRLMLHPKISREGVPQSENLWAPGSNFQKKLSKNIQTTHKTETQQQTTTEIPSIGPMKKLQMRTMSAASMKSSSSETFGSGAKKHINPFIKTENIMHPPKTSQNLPAAKTFQSLAETDKKKNQNDFDIGFDECRRKPIVRTSGPYQTLKERELIQEREQKKLIIGDPHFHSGAATGYKMLNNILFDDKYNPPSNHQFREVNPARFVSKNAFFL